MFWLLAEGAVALCLLGLFGEAAATVHSRLAALASNELTVLSIGSCAPVNADVRICKIKNELGTTTLELSEYYGE